MKKIILESGISLSLALLFSSTALAVDCTGSAGSATSITYLLNQTAVNNFQANYGPCNRILGSLEIRDDNVAGDDISDLTPLSGLTEVGGGFLVRAGTTMSSFSGLENLATVAWANIETVNFSGISDLTGLGLLNIVGRPGPVPSEHPGTLEFYMPNLQSFAGLPEGLVIKDILSINGSGFQTSLLGLPSNLSVPTIYITSKALTSLSGMPLVTGLKTLNVYQNTELISLDGLPAFTNLQEIRIVNNPVLDDLSGLAGTTMADADPEVVQIIIDGNIALISLQGLPVVTQLGKLGIFSNSNLTSLTGLESLIEIWAEEGLGISNNEKLNDCSALKKVLDDLDDGPAGPGSGDLPDVKYGLDGAYVDVNSEGCNSIAEILASGGDPDIIMLDGFESL